jgi:hypothetical protein
VLLYDVGYEVVQHARHCRRVFAEQFGAGIVDAKRRKIDTGFVHVRELRRYVGMARHKTASPLADYDKTIVSFAVYVGGFLSLFKQLQKFLREQVALAVDAPWFSGACCHCHRGGSG